jgi:hypothetical protein
VPPLLLTDDEFRDGNDEPGVLELGFDVLSILGGKSGTPKIWHFFKTDPRDFN